MCRECILRHMPWKVVRLELAESSEFPRGSAGRSYLIRLPLDGDGTLDYVNLEAEPTRATVRRFWPNQPDMHGTVVRTPSGLAIEYEARGADSPQPCILDANRFQIGDNVTMTGPNGNKRNFRVVSLL